MNVIKLNLTVNRSKVCYDGDESGFILTSSSIWILFDIEIEAIGAIVSCRAQTSGWNRTYCYTTAALKFIFNLFLNPIFFVINSFKKQKRRGK